LFYVIYYITIFTILLKNDKNSRSGKYCFEIILHLKLKRIELIEIERRVAARSRSGDRKREDVGLWGEGSSQIGGKTLVLSHKMSRVGNNMLYMSK
jgi:hypothetical protein